MTVNYSGQDKVQSSNVKDIEGMYNWKDVHVSQLGLFPNGFKEIFEGNLDGFLIRGVLSEEELQVFKGNFPNWKTEDQTAMPFGEYYGKKVNTTEGNFQLLKLEDYFSLSDTFREELKDVFEFDIEKRIAETINAVAADCSVEVPANESNQSFIPASIRVCYPYKGAIGSHVGNDFNYKMPEIILLHDMAKLEGQLSFFILVEQPDSGGELALFDLVWPESPESITAGTQLSNEERNEVLENLKTMHIQPKAGDMILFAGGRIWHRVKDIGGGKNRTTIGGFATFSKDEKKIFIWG